VSALAPQAPARPRVPRAEPAGAADARSAPPLRLAPPVTSSRRGLFAGSLFVLLASGLTALLLLHTWAAQDGFTVAKLQHSQARLQATEASLQGVEQRLESPAHLANAARALGMQPIANPRFVTLHSGRVVVRGTAVAVPPVSAGAAGSAATAGATASSASKPSHASRTTRSAHQSGVRSSTHAARVQRRTRVHRDRAGGRNPATRQASPGTDRSGRSAHRHRPATSSR